MSSHGSGSSRRSRARSSLSGFENRSGGSSLSGSQTSISGTSSGGLSDISFLSGRSMLPNFPIPPPQRLPRDHDYVFDAAMPPSFSTSSNYILPPLRSLRSGLNQFDPRNDYHLPQPRLYYPGLDSSLPGYSTNPPSLTQRLPSSPLASSPARSTNSNKSIKSRSSLSSGYAAGSESGASKPLSSKEDTEAISNDYTLDQIYAIMDVFPDRGQRLLREYRRKKENKQEKGDGKSKTQGKGRGGLEETNELTEAFFSMDLGVEDDEEYVQTIKKSKETYAQEQHRIIPQQPVASTSRHLDEAPSAYRNPGFHDSPLSTSYRAGPSAFTYSQPSLPSPFYPLADDLSPSNAAGHQFYDPYNLSSAFQSSKPPSRRRKEYR